MLRICPPGSGAGARAPWGRRRSIDAVGQVSVARVRGRFRQPGQTPRVAESL